MTPYKNYSKFYDVVEGEKQEYIDFLSRCVNHFRANAKTLLELGCGTGYVLLGLFKKGFQVEGLDLSKDMLAVAKSKNIPAKLYAQDMANFNTNKKYDVILSVYDTFNHLTEFNLWKSSFRQVKKHLNEGGVFIFDINTNERLKRLKDEGPHTVYFKDGVYIIRPVSKKFDVYTWEINIFAKEGDKYTLYKDTVKELVVDIEEVKKELKKHFKDIKMFDGEDFILKPNAERVYFACK